MSDKQKNFDPTEEQIANILAKTGSDPRKLAIAYLRAKHRADQADLAFRMMDAVQGVTMSAINGNMEHGEQALKRAQRHARTAKQRS